MEHEIKNILICGIGAVGSIYANKIQAFDSENLRILVDKDRLIKYTKTPIIFNGKELRFNYVLPDEKNFKADLIIIATKFSGLLDARDNIENFVKEDTIILSLLNGVTSEEILAEKYGWDKLLLSYFIGHSAVREGRNIVHDDVNTIVFGDRENSILSKKVKSVKMFFDKAGINYKIPIDMKYSLWLKFMLNVSANQPTAILRATFGEMLENKKFMELAVNIMKEVQLIAKAEGVKNTEDMIEKTIEHLHTMIPEGKTSMLQDVEAGRKTEVDMFAGTIVQLGKKYNIPTPYNKILKEMIEIIQESQDINKTKTSVLC